MNCNYPSSPVFSPPSSELGHVHLHTCICMLKSAIYQICNTEGSWTKQLWTVIQLSETINCPSSPHLHWLCLPLVGSLRPPRSLIHLWMVQQLYELALLEMPPIFRHEDNPGMTTIHLRSGGIYYWSQCI